MSLSARRAWIEIPIVPVELTTLVKSLSARRAWIEMRVRGYSQFCYWVALRKESVDRNPQLYKALSHVRVALRKESVDRNLHSGNGHNINGKSLSARRAWIEIAQMRRV